VEPGSDIGIYRVNTDRPNSNDNLPGGWDQIWHVFELHNLGSPELVNSNGLHDSFLSSPSYIPRSAGRVKQPDKRLPLDRLLNREQPGRAAANPKITPISSSKKSQLRIE
jgi:hypothetical protein